MGKRVPLYNSNGRGKFENQVCLIALGSKEPVATATPHPIHQRRARRSSNAHKVIIPTAQPSAEDEAIFQTPSGRCRSTGLKKLKYCVRPPNNKEDNPVSAPSTASNVRRRWCGASCEFGCSKVGAFRFHRFRRRNPLPPKWHPTLCRPPQCGTQTKIYWNWSPRPICIE